MEFLAMIRNKSFWLLDALRGGRVRQAYDAIKKIDQMDSNHPFVREYQQSAWEALKEAACTNTRAYGQYRTCDFSRFPLITKQDIRQNQDDYLSAAFDKSKLVQMCTSGSTGTPFVCYQNGLKKRRVNAEIIYYSEKVGYRLGRNLSYIRTIVRQNKKPRLKQLMQNQTLIHCCTLDDAGIGRILASVQARAEKGPVTLLAYGSTYTAIKNYFRKYNIDQLERCEITGAISGSDMLFDETREVIGSVLGNVPVVSRYSNEENGVIGQDEGINNVFVINEADYIVEIVDENGRKLPEGKLGRIIVTDLFNLAMPMIRYDTGDMGAIETIEIGGRKKKCISQFSGRRVDMISDDMGNALSPHTITNAMWEFPDVIQFQLIQTGSGMYTLKLNVDQFFDRESDVVAALKRILGPNAVIMVEKVEEIPVLASGKRRYVVNAWIQ